MVDDVNENEVEIEDDALELAAGGIQTVKTNSTYSNNQTIYFQGSL